MRASCIAKRGMFIIFSLSILGSCKDCPDDGITVSEYRSKHNREDRIAGLWQRHSGDSSYNTRYIYYKKDGEVLYSRDAPSNSYLYPVPEYWIAKDRKIYSFYISRGGYHFIFGKGCDEVSSTPYTDYKIVGTDTLILRYHNIDITNGHVT